MNNYNMGIVEIIERGYDELKGYCLPNVIRGYHQTTYLIDNEEIDMLHSMIIIWMNKYKHDEFDNYDLGFNKIKSEFLAEKNTYSKMMKKGTLYFDRLPEERDKDRNNDENNRGGY